MKRVSPLTGRGFTVTPNTRTPAFFATLTAASFALAAVTKALIVTLGAGG